MYEVLGICLSLAALLVIDALGSAAATVVWSSVAGFTCRWHAPSQARLLFTLRVLPLACALLYVALLVSSYLVYEPRRTAENLSPKLVLLAAISAAGLFLAAFRGLASQLATRRTLADWLRNSERVTIHDVSIPAYRLDHPFPVIAVVGTMRPRLFVTSQVLAALTSQELSAAMAHERGHLVSHDNLKRALLRTCRDALTIIPSGRSLERAWAGAAEAAADEHAANRGAATALNLASALVKIARLIPEDSSPAMPAGAFLVGAADSGSLENRVRRLTELATVYNSSRPSTLSISKPPVRICMLCCLAAAVLAMVDSNILSRIHEAMELVVAALQ
jgi:Zn-dependent protease with chaperone function